MPQITSNLLDHFKILPTISRKIISEFQKPVFLNSFRNNFDYLLRGADLVKFAQDKWKRRPELFALKYYDYPEFFHIVLISNNISSRFAFIPENLITPFYIIAPKKETISTILDLSVS